jgi:DNA repair protein RadA/Sms
MSKKAVVFCCAECGSQSAKWLGRCPDCDAWNSFQQQRAAPSPDNLLRLTSASPVPIDIIGLDEAPRIPTGQPQLDRVLGGGIVPGAVTLVGGEPGIGKSTLLLQTADKLATLGTVLYVSGEESPKQIALRARRLGTLQPRITLYTETAVERIIDEIERTNPVAAVVDSIQTVHTTRSPSTPGSIGQVRESASLLLAAAKRLSVPLFLIGHITKEGTIAGPKALEHLVDTVLYFEGDKFQNSRLLRACKNRYGPVGEVAIYQMHDTGLEEVANPSAALLSQRSHSPGSAIVAAVEGTRPLMIEVQGLVSLSHFSTPRRVAMGVDSNRLALLLAVLERKAAANFLSHDVYTNIAGGLQFDEPAIDLGIVAALLSSQANRPIPWDLAIFGEVGLLGEVRSVSQADLRAREAASLGFKQLIVPSSNVREIRTDIDVVGVQRLEDLTTALLGAPASR